MDATEQITRHAVNIRAHRLLIQQILIKLQLCTDNCPRDLRKHQFRETPPRYQENSRSDEFEAKVDAHVAELLSGVGIQDA